MGYAGEREGGGKEIVWFLFIKAYWIYWNSCYFYISLHKAFFKICLCTYKSEQDVRTFDVNDSNIRMIITIILYVCRLHKAIN